MIAIIIINALITIALCISKDLKILKLKDELEIKTHENLALKRVMYENDLIPEKFVN